MVTCRQGWALALVLGGVGLGCGSSDGGTGGSGGGGTGGGGGVVTCSVFGVLERSCYPAGGSTFVDIDSCVYASDCVVPESYSVSRDAIQCVDDFRFYKRIYEATCTEVVDQYEGRIECLVPWHCSGDEKQAGDWVCRADRTCSCPEGGFCPVPLPPQPQDAGVSTDAGAAATDSGVGDGGMSTDSGAELDAGGPSDTGAPMDLGSPSDTGASRDSGSPMDLGPAGPPDSGRPVDAGSGPPGPPGPPDAG